MDRVAVVHIISDPRIEPNKVAAEDALWRLWRWAPGSPVTVRAGRRTTSLTPAVLRGASAGGRRTEGSFPLRLHPATLRELSLPDQGLRCHGKAEEAGDGRPTLQLGPFFGVFGQRGVGPQPFGGHELYFRALTGNGRAAGVPTFVFSARDVDWNRGIVRGFRWYRRGARRGWVSDLFPVPDVVYDRITTRRAEMVPAIRTVRRRFLETPGVTYFNPGFFDKWTIHAKLAEHPDIEPYLPVTERFEFGESLRAFLRRYPTVFLKPTGGSLGLGIVVVNRRRTGYRCRFCTRTGMHVRHYATFAALSNALSRYMGRREYVMQQGIRLVRWAGRNFDIRLLMQKDAGGTWHRTKSYVRVAPPGSPTSNLSTGGTAVRLDLALRRTFGRRRAARIGQRIKECAATVVPLIEQQVGSVLGEMGLDLGVDRAGGLWILEVNSKPYVQMTRGSGSPRAIRLSALRPVRWARYAAGFETDAAAGAAPSDRG